MMAARIDCRGSKSLCSPRSLALAWNAEHPQLARHKLGGCRSSRGVGKASSQSLTPWPCVKALCLGLVTKPYALVLRESLMPWPCIKALCISLASKPYALALHQSLVPYSCLTALCRSLISKPYGKTISSFGGLGHRRETQ